VLDSAIVVALVRSAVIGELVRLPGSARDRSKEAATMCAHCDELAFVLRRFLNDDIRDARR